MSVPASCPGPVCGTRLRRSGHRLAAFSSAAAGSHRPAKSTLPSASIVPTQAVISRPSAVLRTTPASRNW
ncbi:MAG: hypothetical protein GXX96_27190 [Planctomycetaceae bacterium]|nr:hypothetical protein [Planctomycetaceae bacterium]